MLESADFVYQGALYDSADPDGSASEGNAALNTREGLPQPTTFGSGDVARVKRSWTNDTLPTPLTWDAARAVRINVDVQPEAEAAGDTDPPASTAETVQYFATGDPEAGQPGFGFKLPGDGTLQGVVHDGTEEISVGLSARTPFHYPTDRGRLTLSALRSSDQDVAFHVEGDRVGYLDDGPKFDDVGAETIWSTVIDNQTTGDERRTSVVDFAVQQREVITQK